MISRYVGVLRGFSRETALCLFTWAFFWFTGLGITSVLYNLYLLRLGYGADFIGVVVACRLVAFAAFSIPAGLLGKRWGMRRPMLAGLILTVTALVAMAIFVVFPPTWREPVLLLSVALQGMGLALYIVNVYPLLTATTSRRVRNHAFAMQWALQPLSVLAGSLVGGFLPAFFARIHGLALSDPAAFRWSLFVSPALLMVAIYVLAGLSEVGQSPIHLAREPAGSLGRGRAPYGVIVALSIVGLLRWGGRGTTDAFYNVYLDTVLRVPVSQIGMLKAAGQLVAVPAALATPILIARLGKERTTVLAALGSAACLLPLALIRHWSAAGLGFMGMIGLFAVSSAAATVYGQEIVAPIWRTTMSGTTNMAVGFGSAALAVGGGHLIVAIGYRTLFLVCGGLIAAGALLFLLHFRKPRGEFARAPASS
jgi:MFS family permease